MEKVKYDVGFGIVVDSFTCPSCHYNLPNETAQRMKLKTGQEVELIPKDKQLIVKGK